MEKHRQSPKRLKVTTPEPRIIFHSTAESTFIETLSWIGGVRIAKVGLQVSHLPLVTRHPYTRFAKYMKPIGDGWYVNTLGSTSEKYLKLCAINDKLQLGLEIELVGGDSFVRYDEIFELIKKDVSHLDLGKSKSRIMDNTLRVTYDGETYNFNHRQGKSQFLSVIEAIGAARVCCLGLKVGQKDLVTPLRINESQCQCGSYWLNLPSSIQQKRKILATIKIMLHLDMTIEDLSSLKTSFALSKDVVWDNTTPTRRLHGPKSAKCQTERKRKSALPPNPALSENSSLPIENVAKATLTSVKKTNFKNVTERTIRTALVPPKKILPKGSTIEPSIDTRVTIAASPSSVHTRLDVDGFVTSVMFSKINPMEDFFLVAFPFMVCSSAPRQGFSLVHSGAYIPDFLYENNLWREKIGDEHFFTFTLLVVDRYWQSEAIEVLSAHDFKTIRLSSDCGLGGFPTFRVFKKYYSIYD